MHKLNSTQPHLAQTHLAEIVIVMHELNSQRLFHFQMNRSPLRERQPANTLPHP